MATLLKKLKDRSPSSSQETPRQPVWQGPGGAGPQGGVTQGLISRYLCCKERFRLLVMEGLKPADQFNHRLEYGNMWHVCEEVLAANGPTRSPGWQEVLLTYAQQLVQRYPFQQNQVDHWYNVCKVQFPLYVEWWQHHPDVQDRRPLLQEQVFDVPYKLPSGRIVRLRGKWDSIDLISTGENVGIYLQENKTKSEINEMQIKRQLSWDLQTLVYLIALENSKVTRLENGTQVNGIRPGDGKLHCCKLSEECPILGVRYNVVRRPLSGGAGSIRQHKPTKSNPRGETQAQFYARLAGVIKEDLPSYFTRFKVEVSPANLLTFRRQCLDPVLENLCDDHEWWTNCFKVHGDVFNCQRREKEYPHHRSRHFREPFGIYDPVKEGGSADLDLYLSTGSEIGLQRTDNLFPELTENVAAQ